MSTFLPVGKQRACAELGDRNKLTLEYPSLKAVFDLLKYGELTPWLSQILQIGHTTEEFKIVPFDAICRALVVEESGGSSAKHCNFLIIMYEATDSLALNFVKELSYD